MNTSILTVVLAGALLAGQSETPTWQGNYGQARQQGAAQKKPLVVVFGSGADGWKKIVRDGTPAADVCKLMADQYVCVYVDTATQAGKKLEAEFGVTGSVGLVVSDRAGTSQAFWHQGDLTNPMLTRVLQRYSDPKVVVRTTETASSSRISFYPSSDSEVNSGPSSPFDSYCPSCNNVRRRR